MLRQLVTSCGQYPVAEKSIVRKVFYAADSAHSLLKMLNLRIIRHGSPFYFILFHFLQFKLLENDSMSLRNFETLNKY